MVGDLMMSWVHYLLVFSVVGTLVAELVLCRPPLTPEVIKRLGRFDMIYGLSALGLLIVGFGRATGFAKGWAFYSAQPWFWVKIALFAAVGLLSIVPTIKLLSWNKVIKHGGSLHLNPDEVKKLRRYIHAELGLLPFIALAASMMARGL